MQTNETELLETLKRLVEQLGDEGGKISPSIYDTAQRLRFSPPTEGPGPALDWLLDQQHADGGWCDPAVPAARDASTLAAILALHHYRGRENLRMAGGHPQHENSGPSHRNGIRGAYRHRRYTHKTTSQAIEAGLAFLQTQAPQWAQIHLDRLPIAVEVILPRLITEANAAGLKIGPAPYARLYALGRKKLDYIRQVEKLGGLPPSYSWEAFGENPDPDLLDAADSVAHSPAATARWIHLARKNPNLKAAVARAEGYLAQAHQATEVDVPGVVPVFFPTTGFELCHGLNALMLTGLLQHPTLLPSVEPLARRLYSILQAENGVSSGRQFIKDVDDTGIAVSILQTLGYSIEPDYLMQFYKNDHFFTFVQELNPSVFSNAHAVHALALGDVRVLPAEEFLLRRQDVDGKWPADKWHCSWRFTTLEVIHALAHTGHLDAVRRAMPPLLAQQSHHGDWRFEGSISALETAYTLIALLYGQSMDCLPPGSQTALNRAQRWLAENPHAYQGECRWLAKELYSIPKVESAYVQAARIAAELQSAGKVAVA